MKHQINHRWTDEVLFEADLPDDTPSGLVVRFALEKATRAGAYLAGANLTRAYLVGADLTRANLAGADLTRANLDGANLTRANLVGAYLACAYLTRAYLVGADLTRAYLVGAYLAGANLDGAYLVGAYLAGDNLDGAYLDGANLDGAYLVGERPIFQIGPIGSRSTYLVAYSTDKGVVLKTGCFTGSVSEFEAKLQAKHGDNQYAQEYRAALALIDIHTRLWAKPAVAEAPAATEAV